MREIEPDGWRDGGEQTDMSRIAKRYEHTLPGIQAYGRMGADSLRAAFYSGALAALSEVTTRPHDLTTGAKIESRSLYQWPEVVEQLLKEIAEHHAEYKQIEADELRRHAAMQREHGS